MKTENRNNKITIELSFEEAKTLLGLFKFDEGFRDLKEEKFTEFIIEQLETVLIQG